MFELESVWHPSAPVARVWPVLADPRFTWPDWWPGLTAAASGPVVGPDGLAAPGTWARLRVRSPLGYALAFRLDLVEVTPPSDGATGRARLNVSGDLTGRADVTVSAASTSSTGGVSSAGGVSSTGGVSSAGIPRSPDRAGSDGEAGASEVRLLWAVSPVPVWFRVAARVTPRPLAWAHAHVMRAGERGLVERLRE